MQAKVEALESRGYTARRASLIDVGALQDAARAADGVIHVAATGAPDRADVDTQAVAALLEALSGTPKPFVYGTS